MITQDLQLSELASRARAWGKTHTALAEADPPPEPPIYLKLKGRRPQRWPVARRKTVRRAKARAARVARRENLR